MIQKYTKQPQPQQQKQYKNHNNDSHNLNVDANIGNNSNNNNDSKINVNICDKIDNIDNLEHIDEHNIKGKYEDINDDYKNANNNNNNSIDKTYNNNSNQKNDSLQGHNSIKNNDSIKNNNSNNQQNLDKNNKIESNNIIDCMAIINKYHSNQNQDNINNINYNLTNEQIQKFHQQQFLQLVQLAQNQAHMQYKDYLTIKLYYQKNKLLFNNLSLRVTNKLGIADTQQKTNQQQKVQPLNIINQQAKIQFSKIDQQAKNNSIDLEQLQKQIKIKDETYNKDRQLHRKLQNLALLAAKAYYLQSNYTQTLQILQNLLILFPNCTFKLLFQRQLLLIKTLYLHEPPSIALLYKYDKIVKLYNYYKMKCNNWLVYIRNYLLYNRQIYNMYNKVKKSTFLILKTTDDAKYQQITYLLKYIYSNNLNTKIYQGIPVFFISTKWLTKAKKYLNSPKTQLYPGHILNLQLINHIFQLQVHLSQTRQYTDIFLFPVIQSINYQLLSLQKWKNIRQKVTNIEIKRFPIRNYQFTNKQKFDTVVKFIIEINKVVLVIQFQEGLSWERSFLPFLQKSYVGPGQMKKIVKKVNKNGAKYIVEEVVKGGILQHTKNRYRYVPMQFQFYIKIVQNFISDMIVKYDIQSYPSNQTHIINNSHGIIGLKIYHNLIQMKTTKQLNNKIIIDDQNINSFRCVLHFLGSITEISNYYCSNKYVQCFDLKWNNQYIEYVVCFADLMKKMRYSDQKMDYIDYGYFYNYFQKFTKYYKNKLNQTSTYPLLSLIYSIIQPLYYNPIAQNKLQLPYATLQNLKQHGINIQKQINRSQIFSILTQYHYDQLFCNKCFENLGYLFKTQLFMRIDIPKYQQYVPLFLITSNISNKSYKNNNNVNLNKQSYQQIITGKQMLQSQYPMSIKTVQQILIKISTNKNISHIIQLLLSNIQYNNNAINDKKNNIIAVLFNQLNKQCYQIYNKQKSNKINKNINVYQINKILSGVIQAKAGDSYEEQENGKGKDQDISKVISKWFIFVYTVPMLQKKQYYAIVNYKNPNTLRAKAFPQLIKINKQKTPIENVQNEQNIKQFNKKLLSNSQILIQKYKIYSNNVAKQFSNFGIKNNYIKQWIDIYTYAQIGAYQRKGDLLKIQQTQKGEKDVVLCLDQCIERMYNFDKDKQIQRKNNKKQSANQTKQTQMLQKILCHICKKQRYPIKFQKLLKCHKTALIVLNRYASNNPNRISTKISIPLSTNLRPVSSQSNIIKKQSQLYNLKSLLICTNWQIQPNCHSTKQKYKCITKNNNNNKWYIQYGQYVQQYDINQLNSQSVQVIAYQKVEKKTKQQIQRQNNYFGSNILH